MPGDLWAAPDGDVHLLWTERAIDERLREKFFPDAKQSHTLNYAVVRDGKVVLRRAVVELQEGQRGMIASAGRFQVTPDGRLFVVYSRQRQRRVRKSGVGKPPGRNPARRDVRQTRARAA